jgi:hypothetical protein
VVEVVVVLLTQVALVEQVVLEEEVLELVVAILKELQQQEQLILEAEAEVQEVLVEQVVKE